MDARKALLALLVVAATAGCSAGVGNRLAVRPEAVAPPTSLAVAELVDRNNRNAEPVHALTAYTSVSGNLSRLSGALDGTMVLERPRNFNLKLDAIGGREYLKVGSNDQEFWFWSRDSEDNAILVGQYGPGGTVPTGLVFNPDWIIESLGLHRIGPDEESRIKSEKSGTPNLVIFDHFRDDGQGSTTLKRTVYDLASRQVRNHVFYAPDRATKLAVVTPSDFRAVSLGDSENESAGSVEIPFRLRLELFTAQQNSKKHPILEITLRNVDVNPELDANNRQALFNVPEISGYPRKSIGSPRAFAADHSTRSYQSIPSPPTGGSGTARGSANEPRPGFDDDRLTPARLGEPEPFGVEGASLRWTDPLPISPDLAPAGNEPAGTRTVVRPGFPELPEAQTAERPGALGAGFVR